MLKNINLKTRLLISGLSLIAITIMVVIIALLFQNANTVAAASAEARNFGQQNIDQITKSVYLMCNTYFETINTTLHSSLNVARDKMNSKGDIYFADEMVEWDAVNQYTKEVSRVRLSRMYLGETWLGKNKDMKIESPLVDEVKNLVGGTCTIFQRMNKQGDMLRVTTNVEKLDGNRAIGTYIPYTNPDGEPNPVVSTIMSGESFYGRAYVVNRWYLTAYEPIYSSTNEIIGVLYFGIPQDNSEAFRKGIIDIKVGETGYVFIMNAKGNTKGQYVISQNGSRDGDTILETQDADGNYVTKEIISIAEGLEAEELGHHEYNWKNDEDLKACSKFVSLAYYEPLDYVIASTISIDELHSSVDVTESLLRDQIYFVIVIALIAIALATVVWILLANNIASSILKITNQISRASSSVQSGSSDVASAGQRIEDGASKQSTVIGEVTSTLDNMVTMVNQLSANSDKASKSTRNVMSTVELSKKSMEELTDAIGRIKDSSDSSASIIKSIDEIAFQTNLLALNAAVEAARAGEAGKGFAVVAEEVRSLAQRSATAARETSLLIENTGSSTEQGVNAVELVTKQLNAIVEVIQTISTDIEEVDATAHKQSTEIDNLNEKTSHLRSVVKDNAVTAQQATSTSKELSSQAENMSQSVDLMKKFVTG